MAPAVTRSRTSGALRIFTTVLFFIIVNLITLSVFERRLISSTELQGLSNDSNCNTPSTIHRMTEEVINEVQEQVIAMEEDGRLGNLLIETATLLLIGRMANVSVSLLPQVQVTWDVRMPPRWLPSCRPCWRPCPWRRWTTGAPPSPSPCRRHCLCTKCTDCLCPECR